MLDWPVSSIRLSCKVLLNMYFIAVCAVVFYLLQCLASRSTSACPVISASESVYKSGFLSQIQCADKHQSLLKRPFTQKYIEEAVVPDSYVVVHFISLQKSKQRKKFHNMAHIFKCYTCILKSLWWCFMWNLHHYSLIIFILHIQTCIRFDWET